MQRNRQRQWQFTALYLLAAVFLFYFLQKGARATQPKSVAYTEFISEIRAGHLAEVAIGADDLTGTLTDDAAKSLGVKAITASRLPNITDSSLLQDLEAQHIKIIGRIESQSWWSALLVTWLLPIF